MSTTSQSDRITTVDGVIRLLIQLLSRLTGEKHDYSKLMLSAAYGPADSFLVSALSNAEGKYKMSCWILSEGELMMLDLSPGTVQFQSYPIGSITSLRVTSVVDSSGTAESPFAFKTRLEILIGGRSLTYESELGSSPIFSVIDFVRKLRRQMCGGQ